MALTLDPKRTAVLSMDLQTAIVSIYLKDQKDAFLSRAARVLDRARDRNAAAIHVRVGFRPGLPEVSTRNALFAAVKQSEQHQKLFAGPTGEIHEAVAPRGNDIVVVKHRVSAFAGTDLEQILRANDIDTLVLFGIATSGVVLATALAATDADYRVVIVRDCCADMDANLHAALLDGLFSKHASVLSSDELLEVLA